MKKCDVMKLIDHCLLTRWIEYLLYGKMHKSEFNQETGETNALLHHRIYYHHD